MTSTEKNAMQILTESHPDEGPLYTLEVIYENVWKELIDVWYYEKLTVAASFISRQSSERTHRLKIQIPPLGTNHKLFAVFEILEYLK